MPCSFPDVMCRCFLNFSLSGKVFFAHSVPRCGGTAVSYKGSCPYADPKRQRLNGRACDLLAARDGKIAAIGQDLPAPEGEEVLDARGLTVLPAFLDTHCHWRTPGFEYKEDVATGSAAAPPAGTPSST